MIKQRKKVICGLILFFMFAIFMTGYSHHRYKENLFRVETISAREGTIRIRKTRTVKREPNTYSDIKVKWDLGMYNDELCEGKKITVCTDEQVLEGCITASEKGENNIPIVTVEVDWFDTPNEDCWDVVLGIEFDSIEYDCIIPTSCVREQGGGAQLAVAYSRKQRWGLEYFVHLEDTYVYEYDASGTECAIRDIPQKGEGIIVQMNVGAIRENMVVGF